MKCSQQAESKDSALAYEYLTATDLVPLVLQVCIVGAEPNSTMNL